MKKSERGHICSPEQASQDHPIHQMWISCVAFRTHDRREAGPSSYGEDSRATTAGNGENEKCPAGHLAGAQAGGTARTSLRPGSFAAGPNTLAEDALAEDAIGADEGPRL